jgi:hypothetical protein
MSTTLFGICRECDETVEFRTDGENPSVCPECRNIDCIDTIEDEIDLVVHFQKLAELLPNDAELGAKIRALLKEEK